MRRLSPGQSAQTGDSVSIHTRLDIHFDEHPSNAELELEHLGLQACAVSYCNRNLTDGFVSDRAVRGFGKSGKAPKVAMQMVKLGKWERIEGGYQIIGFLDWNPSKVEVLARRAAKAAAGQLGGQRSGESRGKREAHAEAPASTLLRPMPNPSPSPSPSPSPTPTPRGETPGSGIHERPDPELATTFAAALLALGHRVALGPFAWKDISSACAVHWPDVTAAERHEKLRLAVTTWARCTDGDETRGWDHRRFIAWANAGNVSPPPASKPRQVEPKGEIIDVSEADMAEILGGLATTYQGKVNAS
jgi:hypothetical protein